MNDPRVEPTPSQVTQQPPVVPNLATSPSREASPQAARVGRFAVQHFHAKGGIGEVHDALDEELKRDVALKRMPARLDAL